MIRAILLQAGATVIAVLVAGLFAGFRGAVSAGWGGLACTLPNLLFALRLKCVANRPASSYPANFFLGEFVKIAATTGLLVLIVKGYADLHGPAMLIGLVLALQASFLALWKKS